MTKKSRNTEVTKRPVWKRVGRFFIFFVPGLVVLFLLLGLALHIYLTPERVGKFAAHTLQKNYHQHLEMEPVHFSLFNGLEYRNIRLSALPDSVPVSSSLPDMTLKADRLYIKYSLLRLFYREFVIKKIILDNPELEISMTAEPPKTVKSQADIAETSVTKDTLFSPLEIKLNTVQLNNARITANLQDSLQSQHIFLSNLSITLDNVKTPRGDILASNNALGGDFGLFLKKADFAYRKKGLPEETVDINGTVDLKSRLFINSLNDITFTLNLELLNAELKDAEQLTIKIDFPVRTNINGQADVGKGIVECDPISFIVQDQTWLDLSLRADSILTVPYISASMNESRIPIDQLFSLSQKFIPDSLFPDYYLHNKKAAISFAGTSLKGHLPDSLAKHKLDINAVINLSDFGITLNNGEYLIENFHFSTDLKSVFSFHGLEKTVSSVSMNLDSLSVMTVENMPLTSGPAEIDVAAELDQFSPRTISGEMSFPDLVGADFSGGFSLSSSSTVENLSGKAMFTIANFDLRRLPDTPAQGTVGASLSIDVNTLESIAAHFRVNTTPVTLENGASYTFPEMHFSTDAFARTDVQIQTVYLDSLYAAFNDILHMHANGSFTNEPVKKMHLNIADFKIEHTKLVDFMPLSPGDPLQELEVSGFTSLSGYADATMDGDSLTFDVQTRLSAPDISVDYQPAQFSISDIKFQTFLDMNSQKGLKSRVSLDIGKANLLTLRRQAFTNSAMKLQLSSQDFNTFKVDSGYISLPDLHFYTQFDAQAENVQSDPRIDARLVMDFNVQDSLQIIRDLVVSGKSNLTAALVADTSTAILDCRLESDNVNVFAGMNTVIENIFADVTIHQQIDLERGLLIGTEKPLIQTPHHRMPDYMLYRSYFQPSDQSGVSQSTIKIERIVSGEYELNNAIVTAFFGNGRIEVPHFYLDVYNGNIGGWVSIDAANKKPENVSYKLSANVSGVNSAYLLARGTRSEESILNANTELYGSGLNVEQNFDIGGHFYITEIGSRFADNVLRSLDPEGKDSGIRTTRILMNRGFKPRLFTFEIRNGYCYPSVSFKQPWYFPIRLSGGQIEFGRIPLDYFIQ